MLWKELFGVENLSGNLFFNKSGYDLRHLFIGSEGTLGIITGASLKLFAQPQTTETAWVGVARISQAVELLTLMQTEFAERLCSFELVSRFALDLSADLDAKRVTAGFTCPVTISVDSAGKPIFTAVDYLV